jgi:ABC-type phosphate/phosphonate transport system permease subunit
VTRLADALRGFIIYDPQTPVLRGTESDALQRDPVGVNGGRLAEAIEESATGPVEALQATGAPFVSLLSKAYWPQVEPSFWSIALFRWDINIRESAVLGLVGAGGIGVALAAAMSNLYWDQVGLILAVIFAVVIVTEIVTTAIRQRII